MVRASIAFKTNKGFTLIELVVVIVILGILSVTAMPKFLNITTDARTASLEGLKGAIVNSIEISHAKLAIDGLEGKPAVWSYVDEDVREWCEECYFIYGAPGNVAKTWNYILDGAKHDGTDRFMVGSYKAGQPVMAFSFTENFDDSQALKTDNCYIKYTPANKNESYKLDVVECK